MRRFHRCGTCQRRDRSSHASHARASAAGEWEPVDRPREKLGRGVGATWRGGLETRARLANALAHGPRRLGTWRCKLGGTRPWHGDSEVEAIEKRPRELLPIRQETLRGAGALESRIASRPARAHVHLLGDAVCRAT